MTDEERKPLAQSGAEPVAWQSQVRPKVVAFAILMEEELRNNDDKMGWEDSNPCDLCERVQEEAIELRDVVRKLSVEQLSVRQEQNYKNRISSEAADVANMAMMVADVCGALLVRTTPPRHDASAEQMATKLTNEERKRLCEWLRDHGDGPLIWQAADEIERLMGEVQNWELWAKSQSSYQDQEAAIVQSDAEPVAWEYKTADGWQRISLKNYKILKGSSFELRPIFDAKAGRRPTRSRT